MGIKFGECEVKSAPVPDPNYNGDETSLHGYKLLEKFDDYAPKEGHRTFVIGTNTIRLSGIEEDYKIFFNDEIVGERVYGFTHSRPKDHEAYLKMVAFLKENEVCFD